FRLVAGVEAKAGFRRHQLEHEPFLFLADAHRLAVTADITARQAIAQPAARTADHLHMFRAQADFFFEFAKQCVLGRLAALNAALRELPGLLADALGPENLAARIA